MEDVEMASIVERKLSITQMKKETMTDEQFQKYKKNKSNRNKNRALRKEKAKEIENLKLIDNGLQGRIRQLEKEKEVLLDVGKQRLADAKAKINIAKKVHVVKVSPPHAPTGIQQLEKEKEELLDVGRKNLAAAKTLVVISAPRGSKRVHDDNGDESGSKRCREQSESQQESRSFAEYVEAKSTLDISLQSCETKLSKCTTHELQGLSEDADSIKISLMNLTRKSADRILHSKGRMLVEEESLLRDVVAGYRQRYLKLQEDLAFKRARAILPTDLSFWLTEIESQLSVLQQPYTSKDLDVVLLKFQQLSVDVDDKSTLFSDEEDIYMSMESEDLAARFQKIVTMLQDKKRECCEASNILKEVEVICKKLEGFLEEQWELHDSPLDSEKAAEVIALTMGMKLGTLESLLEFHDILASFKCLTDKESYIKRINDVRDKWTELDVFVKTAKADSEKKEFERKRTELVERTLANFFFHIHP